MDSKKILLLLIVLIIYTNYTNYMKSDVSKLYRTIATLKANIKREVQIQKGKYTKKSLEINYDKIFFDGTKYSYSKAMGAMQNKISEATKDICSVNRIKWAQVPTSKEWYDKLRLNVYMVCSTRNLSVFVNNLHSLNTLFVIENARVVRDKKKAILNISMQLISFRKHK